MQLVNVVLVTELNGGCLGVVAHVRSHCSYLAEGFVSVGT